LTETVRETPVGFTIPAESNALVSWHVQMSGGMPAWTLSPTRA
jgi:hypothetical protein